MKKKHIWVKLTLGEGGCSVSFISCGVGLTSGMAKPMTIIMTITIVMRRMSATMCQSVSDWIEKTIHIAGEN